MRGGTAHEAVIAADPTDHAAVSVIERQIATMAQKELLGARMQAVLALGLMVVGPETHPKHSYFI